jgi:hypothetical protein
MLRQEDTAVGRVFYQIYDCQPLDASVYWQPDVPLGHTCRQLRHDTGVLYFRNNAFGAYSYHSKVLDNWMGTLQPHEANAIRTIRWEPRDNKENNNNFKRTLNKWKGITQEIRESLFW